MLTQDEHVASNFCYDLALVLRPTVLQYVLDDIVPILILFGKRKCVKIWTGTTQINPVPNMHSFLPTRTEH